MIKNDYLNKKVVYNYVFSFLRNKHTHTHTHAKERENGSNTKVYHNFTQKPW